MAERTVAAISTPKGEGGISVIRITGEAAIEIADKCFVSVSGKRLCELGGYRAAYGRAVSPGGGVIDEAVALVFRAPKSYTGEDVVEISVHGGTVPARECLKSVFEAGAHPAEPGEFTKRAFLNGKIDLSEAEGVMEIISARSAAALGIAMGAREGRISRDIETITDKMLLAAAGLAAYSDFPDEDIEGLDFEHFNKTLADCEAGLDKLIETFEGGQAILCGVPTAIVGKPNVGKSTLMNMLSGLERSIVTPTAGTTRDVVEAEVHAGNVNLLLADTAGIRETGDEIEHIGVDRAIKKLIGSALVLAVFDASAPLNGEDYAIIEKLSGKKWIAVLNKSDLARVADFPDLGVKTVYISAKNGTGGELLTAAIEDVCKTASLNEGDTVLLNERQYYCAARAKSAVTEARQALNSGITLDAVTVLIDDAVNALLELSGKRATESVVDEIFKNFCIGK